MPPDAGRSGEWLKRPSEPVADWAPPLHLKKPWPDLRSGFPENAKDDSLPRSLYFAWTPGPAGVRLSWPATVLWRHKACRYGRRRPGGLRNRRAVAPVPNLVFARRRLRPDRWPKR